MNMGCGHQGPVTFDAVSQVAQTQHSRKGGDLISSVTSGILFVILAYSASAKERVKEDYPDNEMSY